MTATETRPDPAAVRTWARKNGIRVSGTGNISRHLRESYLEANPDVELQARNARPDLFALADDMAEAELIRTGRLSFEPPAPVTEATTVAGNEEPRSLAEWLQLRDDLAATLAEHPDPREAAEALLVRGWMRNVAA